MSSEHVIINKKVLESDIFTFPYALEVMIDIAAKIYIGRGPAKDGRCPGEAPFPLIPSIEIHSLLNAVEWLLENKYIDVRKVKDDFFVSLTATGSYFVANPQFRFHSAQFKSQAATH